MVPNDELINIDPQDFANEIKYPEELKDLTT